MIESELPEGWVRGWHFVAGNKLRDGSALPADGVELRHVGACVLCESGLHFSERVTDALKYAPGLTLCRVRARVVLRDNDKMVADIRVVEWRIDASKVLVEFAKACARRVLHLWSAPQVVFDFLNGDDSKAEAAKAAA